MVSPLPAAPRQRDLALGLLALAGPVIATNMSRTVMSFVDFVMVSRLGAEEQAAILPARFVVFCAVAFGLGLVSAVNTFVSQSLGKQQLSECSAYGWQGLYLALVAGVVFLPAYWLVEPFFRWADHGPVVMQLEVAYTRIGIFGIAPSIAAAALANFFTAVHRPAIGLGSMVIGNVFNVIANYALIYGHFGFAAMGIEGAAWGTLAATILQVLILIVWILLPRYGRTYGSWHTWRPSPRRLRALAKVGMPAGAQFGIDILTWALFTIILVGQFGPIQLAANNICFAFLEFSFMPAVGLGMALTAMVGRSIGEGRPDLARQFVSWAMFFNVGYMTTIGLTMAVFRYELPALLTHGATPQAAEVIAAAGPLMIMSAVFQMFDGIGITLNRALQGAGDTLYSAVAFLASSVLVLMGGGWLMTVVFHEWASIGPWLAATAHLLTVAALLWVRYRYGPWERMELGV